MADDEDFRARLDRNLREQKPVLDLMQGGGDGFADAVAETKAALLAELDEHFDRFGVIGSQTPDQREACRESIEDWLSALWSQRLGFPVRMRVEYV